jgi:hypothetical protein
VGLLTIERIEGPTDTTRTAGRVLLTLLAFLLPFETPLFRVGPLALTSVELPLYLTIVAWGCSLLAAVRRGGAVATLRAQVPDLLGVAAALWLAVTLVSALAAPAYRAEALKFALRTTSGGLLFFAARDLLRTAAHARAVAVAVVAGAALSAAAALVESAIPNAALWHLFRETAFGVGGFLRTSGTFVYPTVAAMYWEAAIPLAVVVMGRRTGALGATGVAVLILAAIVLSATRTALVGAALAAGAVFVLVRQRAVPARPASLITLALVGLVFASAGRGSTSDVGVRLRFWHDGDWYRARYFVRARSLTLTAGSIARVPLIVENAGALTWPHDGVDSVRLSYHIEGTDRDGRSGAVVTYEGRRTLLAADVAPGERAQIVGLVSVPVVPGRYRLRWDLVRETVAWFSSRGSPTGNQTVEVVDAKHPIPPPPRLARASPDTYVAAAQDDQTQVTPSGGSRPALWRTALALWWRRPLLGVGPDNFRHLDAETIERRGRADAPRADDRLHANSLYLETLADLGLGGMAALGLTIVALLRVALARARAGGGLLAAASAIAAATFFVHGLLDCFFEFTPTFGLYWLLLALAGGTWTGGAWREPGSDGARSSTSRSTSFP